MLNRNICEHKRKIPSQFSHHITVGYYWSTMETGCHQHSRTCHKCQIYADKVHVPPVPLNVLKAPWPFAMWGIDMIGEIKPTASNGHRFILVAIDYFTKWVEAKIRVLVLIKKMKFPKVQSSPTYLQIWSSILIPSFKTFSSKLHSQKP